MDNSKSVKEKIGWMGDAGCNIIFGAIMLFVNYISTRIFSSGNLHLVGVLLLPFAIDAITDPIMGAIADRTSSNDHVTMAFVDSLALPCSALMVYHTDQHHSKVIYAFIPTSLSPTYTGDQHPLCSLAA
jgi:Na+/melibiose symporter-like transporter